MTQPDHRPPATAGLDVVLGLWTDGGAWPEHGGADHDGPEHGALGAPVVGIHGLLETLETGLGLSAPPTPAVLRIAAWQARLEAVTTPERVWAASLASDAWATARLLLGWRDRLVDAGWDPQAPYEQRRLRDLAAAETATGDLPPGVDDRVARVAAAVARDGAAHVERIRLIDDRAHFPAGTRRLLRALEAAGAAVEPLAILPAAAGDTALGRLQRWMTSAGAAPTPTGDPDGSFVVASAESTVVAAETVSQALAALGDERVVLVAQGGGSHPLDAALRLAAQPRAGLSVPSPYRGALQLLPLAFQTAWSPLDVQALLDLVLASPGPLGRSAQWRLARALEHAPSVRHPAWDGAWVAILDDELARAETPGEERNARARVERWRAWAQPVAADPDLGIALPEALAICDRVAAWAIARFELTRDDLYRATARVATDARLALLRLERERLPRPLVERVVDQALHTGEPDSHAVAEAGPRVALPHPGAIWGAADTVVWWDFRDTGERADRAPWTRAERAELARHGAQVDPDTRSAAAMSAAWERAALHARKRLVLVDTHAARPDGRRHPFAHRTALAAKALATRVPLADALRRDELRVGALRLPRVTVTLRPPPAPQATWPTPVPFAALAAGRRESATSLERLVECQLKWALRDVARLHAGRSRAIPDVHRLAGNLAHALAAEVLPPGAPPSPAEAERLAQRLLEEAIDVHAMPLRQPEHAADLTRVRRRLPLAMGALAHALADNRLVVVGTEREVAFAIPGGPEVRGFTDLLTRDASGDAVILDLKWTRGATHRDDLAEGRAVQLATYVAAVLAGAGLDDGGPVGRARAGYFRLMQNEFATLRADGLAGVKVDGPPLTETWDATLAAWRTWTRHAADGRLLAAGVAGAEEAWPTGTAPLREPKCRWCDFAGLCRIGEAT